MGHIAVVSDHPDARPPGLEEHDVTVLAPGLDVLDVAADLVVIDARADLTSLRRLASLLAVPVVAWTADAHLSAVDPSWGLADLLVEPVSAAETATRVRLALAPAPSAVLTSATITVDPDAYRASVAGRPLDLTYTEFELLRFLVAHPNHVHSRDQLLAEVWGYDYFGGTRTVDVHIRRLRAKLGTEHDDLIQTVRNVGYRFVPR